MEKILSFRFWVCSNEASNLGTFLLGITALLTVLCFWRFRKEKRLEKFSNIAEEALNYLDHCIFQAKGWMQTSSSGLVYSSRSSGNRKKFEKASEAERKKLRKMYETDRYELSNHCNRFKQIMLDFFKAKNKAWQLGNGELDSKFEELEVLLQKYPGNVTASLQLDDMEQVWDGNGNYRAKLSMFIKTEAPSQFNTFTADIKPFLRQALLYKPKKGKLSIQKKLTIQFCKAWHKVSPWFKYRC
jgi:hypothetical protein